MLHNPAQDLVKVFFCVFTNTSAGFEVASYPGHLIKDGHGAALDSSWVKVDVINDAIGPSSFMSVADVSSPPPFLCLSVYLFLSLSCPSSRSSLVEMLSTAPSPLHPPPPPPLL